MSQVTQSLIDEFKRALNSGKVPAFTLNEFSQLCFAWEQLQRQRHTQVNPIPMGSDSASICGCHSWADGLGRGGEWKCLKHRSAP